MLPVTPPEFIRAWKITKWKLAVHPLTKSRHLVVGHEDISDETEGTGNDEYRGIAECLMDPVVDGAVVVPGFNDGDGNASFGGMTPFHGYDACQ